MKSLIKVFAVFLSIILTVLCSTTAFAVSLYVDGDYTYADIDDYNVSLYAYSSENSLLTVPAEFSGRNISEIYPYAFEYNTDITGLDFSQNNNRMRIINTKAFNECTELSGDLILPSSIRTLGFAAFQGCVKLASLTVNFGVADIPAQCFNRCSGLKSIILAPSVESIGNLAFAKCSSLESVLLPTSVTYISTSAFNDSAPTLYVYYDSYSHHFAEEKGFQYVVLNPPADPTEPPTEPPTEAPTEVSSELPTEPVTEEPTTEPTQPSSEAPTESNGYYLGDVDCNGSVEIIDVTYIQRHLASLNISPTCDISHGDVDGNDKVEIIDATYINRYLVNIPSRYPIGEWISA